MNAREKILNTVKNNQPPESVLPQPERYTQPFKDNLEKFRTTLKSIGGESFVVADKENILPVLREQFPDAGRLVTTLSGFSSEVEHFTGSTDPHELSNADIAIIPAHFGVAENGAVWITEDLVKERVLPYICQHLAVVIDAGKIVPTMHEAYDLIGDADHGFGGFIAGPSKTADIEQSLVLGAHGPLTMTIFLLEEKDH